MLYVLRIFKLFLEYQDRLLSHDILFTLPTFYQYAYRAITTVLACTQMILKCNGSSVTKLGCGVPAWSLIDRVRQNPFPTLLSSIYWSSSTPEYVTKNTQFNYSYVNETSISIYIRTNILSLQYAREKTSLYVTSSGRLIFKADRELLQCNLQTFVFSQKRLQGVRNGNCFGYLERPQCGRTRLTRFVFSISLLYHT